jgi:hypothetical protein
LPSPLQGIDLKINACHFRQHGTGCHEYFNYREVIKQTGK